MPPKTTNTFDLVPTETTGQFFVFKATHATLGTMYFCVLPETSLAEVGEAFLKVRYQMAEVQVLQYRPIFSYGGDEILWDQTVKQVR